MGEVISEVERDWYGQVHIALQHEEYYYNSYIKHLVDNVIFKISQGHQGFYHKEFHCGNTDPQMVAFYKDLADLVL